MNKKALQVLGIDKSFKDVEGSTIERDASGNPTGLFLATPSPKLFYALLAKLPSLKEAEAEVSTQHIFNELAKFGLTSVIDAGGGGFEFPNGYKAPMDVLKEQKIPLRVSFNLFTQHPGKELQDYEAWTKNYEAGQNFDEHRDHGFELEGGGEWILWAAGDYGNFRSPRYTQVPEMESQIEPIIQLFVNKRWPFRIHATYDESISRILNVIEKINSKTPLNGLRWSFDHAETLKAPNMDRIKALGVGIAIQDRLYFLGDDYLKRYGAEAARTSPPVVQLIKKGIPVGMGTDATRSSFNPWLGLYFLVSGKTASGAQLLGKENLISREKALELYSLGSAWFSQEETVKGRISVGQFADFAILTEDYLSVPEHQIKNIKSVLTVVDGKVAFGDEEFSHLSPKLPDIKPDWSPLKFYPSFYNTKE